MTYDYEDGTVINLCIMNWQINQSIVHFILITKRAIPSKNDDGGHGFYRIVN